MAMTKVALTLGFAILAITSLASVSSLQCCKCTYEEDKYEQCNCRTNPPKKDCSHGRPSNRLNFGSAAFNKKEGETTEPSPVCGYTTLKRNGKLIVARDNTTMTGKVPATCKMEKLPSDENENITDLESCNCNTDWCNCIGSIGTGTSSCGQPLSSLALILAFLFLIARM
jgi:hypothetical protein